jgi:AcrR family transcriptional regulator
LHICWDETKTEYRKLLVDLPCILSILKEYKVYQEHTKKLAFILHTWRTEEKVHRHMENHTRRDRERQVRESEIVTAAIVVFSQKGFDNAAMDEIAQTAQFTKRTLYQYFANKEELYFAAALRGMKQLFAYLREVSENGSTGYEKICRLGAGYYQFYQESPEVLRIISYIGHVKSSAKVNGQRQKDLQTCNDEMFGFVARTVAEGMTDGSIRGDLDAGKVTCSLVFMITGFFNLLSMTGNTFMKNFDLQQGDFCAFSIQLLTDSIKSA